jgi:hypothetical protein
MIIANNYSFSFLPIAKLINPSKEETLSSLNYGNSFSGIMCPWFDCFINSVCVQIEQDKEFQSTAGKLQ